MAFIAIVLFLTCCLNWWCLTHMCLVLILCLGSVSKWSAPALSSKTDLCVLIRAFLTSINLFKYSMMFLISRKSLVLYDNSMCSASVVEKATSVWSFLNQHMGQFATFMTHPVCDRANGISSLLKSNQLPANSASTTKNNTFGRIKIKDNSFCFRPFKTPSNSFNGFFMWPHMIRAETRTLTHSE